MNILKGTISREATERDLASWACIYHQASDAGKIDESIPLKSALCFDWCKINA